MSEFSGTWAQSPMMMARGVERVCRFAYTLAELDPRQPPGIGLVFLELVGRGRTVLVDVGVAPGDVSLTFSDWDPFRPEAAPGCIGVRIARRQTLEQRSMAYARACARFMGWVYGEHWPTALLDEVALGLIMPEACFVDEMRRHAPAALARAYRVDVEAVLKRQRFLRGTRDSSERPAVREHA